MMKLVLDSAVPADCIVEMLSPRSVHGCVALLSREWRDATPPSPLRRFEDAVAKVLPADDRLRALQKVENRLHRLEAMREEVLATGSREEGKTRWRKDVLEERAPRSLCRGGDERRFTLPVRGWGDVVLAHRAHTYEYDLVSGRWSETTRRLSAGTRDPRLARTLGLSHVEATSSSLRRRRRRLRETPGRPERDHDSDDSDSSSSSSEARYCGVVWEGAANGQDGARCCFDFFERLQSILDGDARHVVPGVLRDLGFEPRDLLKRGTGVEEAAPFGGETTSEEQLDTIFGDAPTLATRPLYVALLSCERRETRRAMVRAAALSLQRRRSLEHRARLGGVLRGACGPPTEAAFHRVCHGVALRAPARSEQLWRGNAVEVIFLPSQSSRRRRLLLHVRQEDLTGSRDTSADATVGLQTGVTTVLAVEEGEDDAKSGFVVVAGPPDRRASFRVALKAHRRWTKTDPLSARESLALASTESLQETPALAEIRRLFDLPPATYDARCVLELLRAAALSFVLGHTCTLDPTDRHDGLVVHCLFAANIAPAL